MPTFHVSGKRQQTVSSVVIADDETQARSLFLARNGGVTGIKVTRKKDVIMAEQPSAGMTPAALKPNPTQSVVAPSREKAKGKRKCGQ